MRDLWHWLRAAATENWSLKVLAVLIAVLIDIVVRRDSVRETVKELPISLTGISKNQVLGSELPETVKVRVRGRWADIRALHAESSAHLLVDVSTIHVGERFIFDRRRVEQQLPSRGIEVLDVQPPSLDIRLEAMQKKTVPVEAVVVGEPAAGNRVAMAGIHVEPKEIQVFGPASTLKTLRSVKTVAQDLQGLDADLHATVALQTLPRLLRPSQNQVLLDISLEQSAVLKTVPNLAVSLRGCPAGKRCTVEPLEISADLQGSAAAIASCLQQGLDNAAYLDLPAVLVQASGTASIHLHDCPGVSAKPRPDVANWSVLGESAQPAAAPTPATR